MRQRPWLGGVAAGVAFVAGWAGLAAIGGSAGESSREAIDTTPRQLEIPRGFPRPSSADRAYYSAAASQVETAQVDDVLLRWDFMNGLPKQWRPAPAEDAPQPKLYPTTTGFAVETTAAPLGYQLVATPVVLKAGRYVVVVRAGIVRGGIQLGVLDFDANAWVSTRLFWSSQPGVEGADLVAPVSLARATRVQLVLANWARVPRRSLWELREVKVARRAASRALTRSDRAYFEKRAAPTPEPTLQQYDTWNFGMRLPSGWTVTAGALPTFEEGAIAVETASGRSDYQLQSSDLGLAAGRYEIVVHGAVVDGGIQIGALDLERDQWIATRTYWQAQRPERGYVVPFKVEGGSKQARIVLANWSPRNRSSEWVVTRIELRRHAP